MGREVASVGGKGGAREKPGRPPGWQLRQAWVRGGLLYILVVVPVVAGSNDRGPLASILAPRPNPNVITVYAKTRVPAAPIVQLQHRAPPIEVRLGELILLLSIPTLLVFATLRWLLWDKMSHD